MFFAVSEFKAQAPTHQSCFVRVFDVRLWQEEPARFGASIPQQMTPTNGHL